MKAALLWILFNEKAPSRIRRWAMRLLIRRGVIRDVTLVDAEGRRW